jgi:hypothetical protein
LAEPRGGSIAVDLTSERFIMDGTRRVDEWIGTGPSVPSVRLIFVSSGRAIPGRSALARRACRASSAATWARYAPGP